MTLTSLDFAGIVSWVTQHPMWAYAALLLIALTESLVLVGLLVPGGVMMFGAGALIAGGALQWWPSLWIAAAGALMGDASSFWIGRHYGRDLAQHWPLTLYPSLLPRGVSFFQRYGSMSIFLGRFIGPLRPVMPAVAGMLYMSPRIFFIANLASALCWAPLHLLPGVIFGASLELAAAVSARLAILLIAVAILIWLCIILIRISMLWLRPKFTTTFQFLNLRPRLRYLLLLLGLLVVGRVVITLEGVLMRDGLIARVQERHAQRQNLSVIDGQAWWDDRWHELPVWRIDLEGEHIQPITVQWAGTLDALTTILNPHGWHRAQSLSAKNLLLLFDTSRPAEQIPIFPRVHDGYRPALALVRSLPRQPHSRLVLRLWPSSLKTNPNNAIIWLGTVTREDIRRPLDWFNLPQESDDFTDPRQQLAEALNKVLLRVVTRTPSQTRVHIVWDQKLLLAAENPPK